jgi:hypothetical protein
MKSLLLILVMLCAPTVCAQPSDADSLEGRLASIMLSDTNGIMKATITYASDKTAFDGYHSNVVDGMVRNDWINKLDVPKSTSNIELLALSEGRLLVDVSIIANSTRGCMVSYIYWSSKVKVLKNAMKLAKISYLSCIEGEIN